MKSFKVTEALDFHDKDAHAQPLYVDHRVRIFRFMLRPGQQIAEHRAPSSPFYVVVVKGKGVFAAADGEEREFGPGSLVLFETGENHSVRALDEELVFVGFLEGMEGADVSRILGEIGRQEAE